MKSKASKLSGKIVTQGIVAKERRSLETARRVGRPVTVGDERVNLFISGEDRKQVDATIARAAELRHKVKLSVSYIFREGARRFCAHLNSQLDKATKGALHAKRRKHQMA